MDRLVGRVGARGLAGVVRGSFGLHLSAADRFDEIGVIFFGLISVPFSPLSESFV